MQAVWLDNGRLEFRENVPRPACRTGDALIGVVHAGICGTDMELLRGYASFTGIPGHEFVGRVGACESIPDMLGQRVVGRINIRCDDCNEHCPGVEHCPGRRAIGIRNAHGAFAEHLALPTENLHVLPGHVNDRQAVFAEPVAAALQILEQVDVGPGQPVLLIGAGKLGQLVARVLATTGCALEVVARHARQAALLERAAIVSRGETEIRPGAYDLVVEATGSPDGLGLAIEAVRPRGTIVLKSTCADAIATSLADIVVNEITLIGSRCGPMAKAVALLASGRLDLEPLIDGEFALRDVGAAFDRARRPGAGKVLLSPAA